MTVDNNNDKDSEDDLSGKTKGFKQKVESLISFVKTNSDENTLKRFSRFYWPDYNEKKLHYQSYIDNFLKPTFTFLLLNRKGIKCTYTNKLAKALDGVLKFANKDVSGDVNEVEGRLKDLKKVLIGGEEKVLIEGEESKNNAKDKPVLSEKSSLKGIETNNKLPETDWNNFKKNLKACLDCLLDKELEDKSSFYKEIFAAPHNRKDWKKVSDEDKEEYHRFFYQNRIDSNHQGMTRSIKALNEWHRSWFYWLFFLVIAVPAGFFHGLIGATPVLEPVMDHLVSHPWSVLLTILFGLMLWYSSNTNIALGMQVLNDLGRIVDSIFKKFMNCWKKANRWKKIILILIGGISILSAALVGQKWLAIGKDFADDLINKYPHALNHVGIHVTAMIFMWISGLLFLFVDTGAFVRLMLSIYEGFEEHGFNGYLSLLFKASREKIKQKSFCIQSFFFGLACFGLFAGFYPLLRDKAIPALWGSAFSQSHYGLLIFCSLSTLILGLPFIWDGVGATIKLFSKIPFKNFVKQNFSPLYRKIKQKCFGEESPWWSKFWGTGLYILLSLLVVVSVALYCVAVLLTLIFTLGSQNSGSLVNAWILFVSRLMDKHYKSFTGWLWPSGTSKSFKGFSGIFVILLGVPIYLAGLLTLLAIQLIVGMLTTLMFGGFLNIYDSEDREKFGNNFKRVAKHIKPEFLILTFIFWFPALVVGSVVLLIYRILFILALTGRNVINALTNSLTAIADKMESSFDSVGHIISSIGKIFGGILSSLAFMARNTHNDRGLFSLNMYFPEPSQDEVASKGAHSQVFLLEYVADWICWLCRTDDNNADNNSSKNNQL